MANKGMFLFWGSGSMPCWRPMIVLAEKGLWKGLPQRVISFDTEENRCEEIMKINPRGQVPTFKDGNIVINESAAICMYLEKKYSDENNRLVPKDTDAEAKMYQRIFESENVMNKVISPIAYVRFLTEKGKWTTDEFESARAELKLWNNYLEGAEYLAGGNFSLADVMFFPYLAFLVRLGVKFETNTNLQKYYDHISKRPSIQETAPPHWKECPSPNTMDDLVA